MKTAAAVADLLTEGTVSDSDRLAGLVSAAEASGLSAPQCVVHPTSTDDVSRVLAWASASGVGVLPVGSGDRVRLRGQPSLGAEGEWLAVCTDRLSGIEIYEAADLTLTAGAGTPVQELDDVLRGEGQWMPCDPPFVFDRSLGGLVAEGASGPLWAGYGELRNHVLGMTVVTGDGRVLRLGGRVVKNVAGFDLLKPMTGSRGTLAVITSVCLRAFPEPAEDRLLRIEASEVGDVLDLALTVGTAPVLPVSCVVVDGAQAAVLVRLHGAVRTVDADQLALEDHVGRSFEVLGGPEAESVVRDARDRAASLPFTVEVSVRPSRLPAAWQVAGALDVEQVAIDAYAGRMRLGLAASDANGLRELTRAVEELGGSLRVARAPGALSAGSEPSAGEARLVAGVRRAFDPEEVFWPARA
jgi:glycolate oxidase FAD binding subunit